jgi:Protein of unknown function (DUF3054)
MLGPGILSSMKRWFWILDSVAVVMFVLLGRESHDLGSGWWATLQIAAPFLLGLAVGTAVVRAWRTPGRVVTGLTLGATTAFVGLILRRTVFGDGTALPFVIVATLFLVASMVGWRLVAILVGRNSARRTSAVS